MSRLGGKKVKIPELVNGNIDHKEIWSTTLSDAPTAIAYKVKRCKNSPEHEVDMLMALSCPDKVAIAAGNSAASALIAAAQEVDPRLVRKTKWVRGEEGEECCPAMLLAGEETPFFRRKREDTANATGGEPVIVTLSTDANEVTPGTLAAFIATVNLVQQFRPVHVVWQGAWLDADRYAGFIFHVPLVTGEMDFERLAFAINSERRDNISFSLMFSQAVKTGYNWNGCSFRAEQSYLPGSVDFVTHAGIAPDAESVAARAAKWLGWEPNWLVKCNERDAASAALSNWGEEQAYAERSASYKAEPLDAETRKRWDREAKERTAQAKRDADERANVAQR